MVSLPPLSEDLKDGTGRLRLRMAIVEKSSNTPADFAYSMRTNKGVNTVKRASLSELMTTAFGSATGL